MLCKPALVQCNHRSIVGSRAVTHHKQRLRLRLPVLLVCSSPGCCCRAVLHKSGIGDLRVHTVIGYNSNDAARGQRFPNKGIVCAITTAPAAAVKKYDDGRFVHSIDGQVHIEHLSFIIAVGLIGNKSVGILCNDSVYRSQGRATHGEND